MEVNIYDEDYFENGLDTGKSCYRDYRWLPELTIPMAHFIIKHLGLRDHARVLDYGCAKGFTVKALRMLCIDAEGCDVSTYALEHADEQVRPYLHLGNAAQARQYDWIISKDVLEHLDEQVLDEFLETALASCDKMFHVIPLGYRGKFRVPAYAQDVTHQIAEDELWWANKFRQHGWELKDFYFAMAGIKENWTKFYSKGNGFFLLCHH